MNYNISHPTKVVNCEIDLPSSKSISNRLLIIQALSENEFQINNLSNSDDTIYLKQALKEVRVLLMLVQAALLCVSLRLILLLKRGKSLS